MSINSVVNDTVTSVSVVNALKPLPPTISGYSVAGKDDLALDPAGGQTVQINGTGFLPGATITFDGSAVAVVTYVNPNQLTFTSPAKTAGTYTIYAVNPDGGTAIYVPGIIYSTLPTWTTTAGSLGSYFETTSISNTVVAAGDAPVTYSLFSGSLPTGSTLSANGVITGTAPVDSSSTTYSFTIQASDAQLQDSTRSFSLTINVDAVTWVSPANATTYTSAVDSAIANVTLSATDAAGYNVSYSANALPTGLSLSGANITGTPTVIADSSTLLTATAATTNRTAVRTINWSITVANDVYFEYNTLLIPGASTTFVDDASTNNFAVTINGDTKPNNFNPYTPGYYSNYFDGTGDYLTTSSSSNFTFTGNFTIEMWVYLPNGYYQQIQRLVTSAGPTGYPDYNSSAYFSIGNDGGLGPGKLCAAQAIGTANPLLNDTATIPINQWVHIALVRNGSAVVIYKNGVSVATATNSGTWDFNYLNAGIRISGSGWSATEGFQGYMSNLRMTNTAVYSSAFTPPTTPLTAISGTSLLTCQSNRFIDNSTNAFTITRFGDTTVNSFQPFTPNTSYSSYGSGYFDGTGDYLITPSDTAFTFGTGDFTIECWVYLTNSSATTQTIMGADLSVSTGSIQIWYNNVANKISFNVYGYPNFESTSTVSIGNWIHLAFTRSSGTFKMFINGTQSVSGSMTNNLPNNKFVIGRGFATIDAEYSYGYISDVRVVKGTAVYTTTFTPPSVPLTAISGTSLLTLQNNQPVNNSTFLDNSTNNFFVTRNGNTTQGTFSPYGGNWSNYFDGNGDWLELPTNSMVLGSNNFTFEAWIFPIETSHMCVINGQTNMATVAGSSFSFNINGDSAYLYSGSSTTFAITAPTVTRNVWSHIAYVRTGGTFSIYLNGTRTSTTSTLGSSSINTGTYGYNAKIGINGGATAGNNDPFSGYISNLRGIIGSGGYDATQTTITVPTTTLTTTANTALLTCQSNRFIDNSTNAFAITAAGNTSVQRFSPFNPSSLTPTSYSGYFDGTGDYLTIPASTILDVGNTSWTIECWVYMNNTTGTQMIVGYNNLSAEDFWDLTVVSGVPTFKRRIGGSSVEVSGGTISANIFTNVTVVRNGTAVTIYLNGSSVATNANVSMPTSMSDQILGIGANRYSAGYDYYFNGFISNLRMVKGTAVYTSNFTPSTTPLTAIANTSLLTLQSPTFIDNSTNNFTISAFGNSKPTIQNPFGYTSATTNGYTVSTIGGSGYFDGTGDNLSIASQTQLQLTTAGAFTIECFAYPSAAFTSNEGLIAKRTGANYDWQLGLGAGTANGQVFFWNGSTVYGSGINLILYQWNHVAVTWDLTTLRIFVNGVLGTTYTSSFTLATQTNATVNIGANFTGGGEEFIGYISDVRLIKGTAVYKSNFVPPSAPLTAVQNTSLLTNMTSAGVYDAAMMNNMETVGGAQLSTAVSKFGGSSMSFDGTGDYMIGSAFSNPIHSIGSGNFTIEMWLYTNANKAQILIDTGTAGGSTTGIQCALNASGYPNTVLNNSIVLTSSILVSTTTWTHVAWVRSSGTLVIYVNGVSGGSVSNSTNISDTGLTIGTPNDYRDGSSTYHYNGYIDDLRITKGYARYTTTFTPPTSAFPVY